MAILSQTQFMAKSGMAHGQRIDVEIDGKHFLVENVNGFVSKFKTGDTKQGHFDIYGVMSNMQMKLLKSYRYGGGTGEGTEAQVFEKLKREIVRLR